MRTRFKKAVKDQPFKIYGEDFIIPCKEDFPITKNTLIIGSAGTGKCKAYLYPNVCEDKNSNYIIAANNSRANDMKNLLPENYSIKDINDENARFNPMLYLQTKQDVEAFVKAVLHASDCDSLEHNKETKFNKAEHIYLVLLMLIIRGLYADSRGFSYPNDKYNLVSLNDFLYKEECELENVIQGIKGRFPNDKLENTWLTYKDCIKNETESTIHTIKYSLSIRLIFLHEYSDFFSGDNLSLHNLFEKDKQAIVMRQETFEQKTKLILILGVINIMLNHSKFATYTKFILKDFLYYGNEIYNFESLFTEENCSVDITTPSFEALAKRIPNIEKTFIKRSNVIYTGTAYDPNDLYFYELINNAQRKHRMTLKRIKKINNIPHKEIVFINGYGAFVCNKYICEKKKELIFNEYFNTVKNL